MTVEEAITLFLDHRRDRIAASSLTTYTYWLRRWQNWRQQRTLPPDLATVTLGELQDYLRSMDNLKPASVHASWSKLKSLWRLLDRRGLLTDPQRTIFDHMDGLAQPRVPLDIKPLYSDEDIEKLIAACDSDIDPEGEARNKAIIFMLWESGMRVSELCGMVDEKTDPELQRAVIIGKGNKQRWVFWHDRTASELDVYLSYRKGDPGGPLFRGLGPHAGKPLNRETIRSMLRRRAQNAGIQLIAGSPIHALRHKFAHDALDAGVDSLDLQQLMGHASIVSTMRYTRRDPEKLARIHQRIKKT